MSTINIGDNNKIEKSNISIGKKKEKFISKLFWKLIVPVIVAVAAAAIIYYLGVK